MQFLAIVLSLVLLPVGGLWLLQGTGLVSVPPILCVAECEPLVGPSLPWALAGLASLAIGAILLWRALRPRPPAA